MNIISKSICAFKIVLVSKLFVFPEILKKNIEIPYNHICTLLTAE